LIPTVATDYHGFNDNDYVAPQVEIDERYLDRLGHRIQWPVLEEAV